MSWIDDTLCEAVVWHREQYRRTGRGPSGFEMHYTKDRCARKKQQGQSLCWQHRQSELRGRHISRIS